MRNLARVLERLGSTRIYVGNTAAAREQTEAGLALAWQLDDELLLARLLFNQAKVFTAAGAYAEAQAVLEQGLTLQRANGDQRELSFSLLPKPAQRPTRPRPPSTPALHALQTPLTPNK